jgi:hypothetical protein
LANDKGEEGIVGLKVEGEVEIEWEFKNSKFSSHTLNFPPRI